MADSSTQTDQDKKLLEIEKQAMIGDRTAALVVVSLCRQYRQLIRQALDSRYADGTIDGYSATRLADEVASLEEETATREE